MIVIFNILVVEDDKNTRKLMSELLKANRYRPFLAANAAEAINILNEQYIDLMIIDIMMPKVSGYELTKQLRDEGNDIPILLVSAKQQAVDKRQVFLVGADDYMVKPVDEVEMLFRIKAILRRAQIVNDHKLFIGEVTLDYDTLTVTRKENIQILPPKEFYLLFKLLSYPGKIFTRIQLMDEFWGRNAGTAENTIDVHINRLRNRFKIYPEFEILTVRGLGYKAIKKTNYFS
ncbi:Heme response regulator HssR [compost metagenome]